MPNSLFVPSHAFITDQRVRFQEVNQPIMIVEISLITVNKGDVDALALVLPVNDKARFELHLHESLTIDMTSDEVSALPVIGQSQTVEAIIRKPRRDLVEIVVFLLARIERSVWDGCELAHAPSSRTPNCSFKKSTVS